MIVLLMILYLLIKLIKIEFYMGGGWSYLINQNNFVNSLKMIKYNICLVVLLLFKFFLFFGLK